MIKLFYAPGTCATASHIALQEAGADYEAVRLSFKDEEQRKAPYLAINPKGRVPALVTDAGIITETPAILGWIAQTWPQAHLAPADPFGFAQVQAINSYLCSTVHVNHAHGRRASRWSDDAAAMVTMQAKVPETMFASMELLERTLFKGPWVMGSAYSVCDPYLFTLAGWLEGDGVPLSGLPLIAEHRERMLARPAVKAVLAVQAAPA
jgi:glutathione S-transferase